MGSADILVWLQNSERLQAALIGAITALSLFVLRDIFLSGWEAKRRRRAQQKDVFREHVGPISLAAVNLMWRLDEILNQGRDHFLLDHEGVSEFEKYKFYSTIFRLCTLLASIRIYRLAASYFTVTNSSKLKLFEIAVGRIEDCLSSGLNVEKQRVKNLLSVFAVELIEKDTPEDVMIEIDHLVQRHVKGSGFQLSSDVDVGIQKVVVSESLKIVSERCGTDPVSADLIDTKLAEAANSMSIREAWIYKDYVSGVAELVMPVVTNKEHEPNTISYADFESIVITPTPDQKRWLDRVTMVFYQLDVKKSRELDARNGMLRGLMISVAKLVLELSKQDKNRHTISEKSRSKAQEIWKRDQLECQA